VGKRWLVLLGVAAFLGVGSGCIGSSDCGGPPALEATFVGEVTGIDGDEVAFLVEEVAGGEVGAVTGVGYGKDADLLHVGRRYRVEAWRDGGRLTSDVNRAGGCSTAGTRNADGSPIDSGWLRDFSWGTVATRVGPPLFGVVAGLLALVWLLGRRSRQLEHDPS
jgi:hypothetical protein